MTCVRGSSWGPWEEAEEGPAWMGLLIRFWQDELIHPWTIELGTRILPKILAASDSNQPVEQKWNTLFMVWKTQLKKKLNERNNLYIQIIKI